MCGTLINYMYLFLLTIYLSIYLSVLVRFRGTFLFKTLVKIFLFPFITIFIHPLTVVQRPPLCSTLINDVYLFSFIIYLSIDLSSLFIRPCSSGRFWWSVIINELLLKDNRKRMLTLRSNRGGLRLSAD